MTFNYIIKIRIGEGKMRKNGKRFLSLFLSFAMVFTLTNASLYAEGEVDQEPVVTESSDSESVEVPTTTTESPTVDEEPVVEEQPTVQEETKSSSKSTETSESKKVESSKEDDTSTEYEVTFSMDSGVRLIVNDLDVTDRSSASTHDNNGKLQFHVSGTNGYEIESVQVNGKDVPENESTSDPDDYILDSISKNETVVVKTKDMYPKQSFSDSDGGINVTVDAQRNIFPKGATMQVEAISKKKALDALESATDAEVSDASGVNITFYDKDGNEIQPKGDVKVTISLDTALDGDSFSVVHLDDNGSVSKVADADKSGAEFNTDSFSIYIIGGETKVDTYIFVDENGDKVSVNVDCDDGTACDPTTEQRVKTGETVYLPETPTKKGYKFVGWQLVGSDSTYVTDEFVATTASDTTYTYQAVFEKANYIIFMDKQGRVSTVKDTAENADGTVNTMNVRIPLGSEESVTGWYRDEALTDPVGETVAFEEEDVVLYPKVEKGHYLYFSTGEGASYVESQFVSAEGTTTRPSDPTCPGYTFVGWATTQGATTADFTFGQELTENQTAYAVWRPNTNVTYTIIYWKQSINDDKNASDSEKTYDYAESITRTGTAGATISSVPQRSYANFHYNRTDQNVTINGDGSTIVNVYYDRNVLTITFNTYTYTATTSTRGTQYGLVNGQYVQLTRSGRTWYVDNTPYTGTRYTRSNSRNNSYSYTGLYGQTLAQNGYTWPSTINWNTSSSGTGGTRMTFLDAFIFDDVSEATDNKTKLNLYDRGNVTGSYTINHYKQNLNGSYSYSSPNNSTASEGYRNWTFTNKYDGFTVNSYYIGSNASASSNWTNISAEDSVYYNNNLYVRYERNSYKVEFYNYNGISRTESVLYEGSLSSYASYVPDRPDELDSEYEFMGWYKDKECTQEFDFSTTMPANNIVLYAKWEAPKYTGTYYLTINGDGGSKTAEISYGTLINENDMPIVKDSDGNVIKQGDENYVVTLPEETEWVGWATKNADGTYTTFNFSDPIFEHTELYPYYLSTKAYEVTYDVGEGSGSVTDSTKYSIDSNAVVKSNDGVTPPNGKVFLYWIYNNEIYYPGSKIKIDGEITLKAVYGDDSKATTLTYKSNYPTGYSGQEVTSVISCIVNNGVVEVATPDSLGISTTITVGDTTYVFDGWKDEDGNSYQSGNQVGVDVTDSEKNILYAQWREVKYYKVTIQKEVTGNMGDMNKDFDFTYTVSNGDIKDTTDLSGSATLKNGGSVSFEVRENSTVEVTETTTGDGYSTSYRINDSSSSVVIPATVTSISEDTTIVFTNDKSMNNPTGINLGSNAPWILLILIAIVGVFFKKRQHGEE